jgi:hypothetical protein
MDDALELGRFLPVSFKTRTEEEYVAFLWDAFQSNYTSGKYEFASLAFHLLYMSFVSFSIWQIRLVREQDFQHALVGFQSAAEMKLLEADSPFKFYDKLKESQIFRFLKLIGCTNEHVGEFAKFVQRRNKIAHPSGTVFFNDQSTIDAEIREMMHEVENIQGHMRPIISEVYERFLVDSSNVDEREYASDAEEIEATLIHRNYISTEDLRVCLSHDITKLVPNEKFSAIESLHRELKRLYAESDAEPTTPMSAAKN